MISPRVAQPETDPHELEHLRHENARLRKSLSLRWRLEEVVADNARLRRALHQYGRHTHPNCHDLINNGSQQRHPCLCGLDEQLKENSGV